MRHSLGGMCKNVNLVHFGQLFIHYSYYTHLVYSLFPKVYKVGTFEFSTAGRIGSRQKENMAVYESILLPPTAHHPK